MIVSSFFQTQNDNNHINNQIFLLTTFFLSIFLISFFSNPLIQFSFKYLVIPFLFFKLFKYDSFLFLGLPFSIFYQSVGPYFNNVHVNILTIYLPLLLVKLSTLRAFRWHKSFSILTALIVLQYFYFQTSLEIPSSYVMFLTYTLSVFSSIFVFKHVIFKPEKLRLYSYVVLLTSTVCISGYTLGFVESSRIDTFEISSIGIEYSGVGISDRNYASLIACLGLPFLIFSNELNFKRFLIVLFLLFIGFGIVRSGSRSGSLIIGFLLVFSFIRNRNYGFNAIIISSLVLVLLAVFPSIIDFEYIGERWSGTLADYNSKNYDDLSSNRTIIWGLYLSKFSTQEVLTNLFGGNILNNEKFLSDFGDGNVTHNLLIDLIFAYGLIGGSFILWFFINRIKSIRKTYQETNIKFYYSFLFSKIIVLILGFSLSLVNTHYFWILLFL